MQNNFQKIRANKNVFFLFSFSFFFCSDQSKVHVAQNQYRDFACVNLNIKKYIKEDRQVKK